MELPGLAYCTDRDAAALLGITQRSVQHALLRKNLAGFKLGRRWFVWLDDVPSYHYRMREKLRANGRRHIGNAMKAFCTKHQPRALRCPRCEMVVEAPGPCALCRAETAGIPYYAGRQDWTMSDACGRLYP